MRLHLWQCLKLQASCVQKASCFCTRASCIFIWASCINADIRTTYCRATQKFSLIAGQPCAHRNGLVATSRSFRHWTHLASFGKSQLTLTLSASVVIFPKESCSCLSTSSCYHILAVKLSLGAHSEKLSTRNLTYLRSNTQSKKDKKSRRKRPRAKDLDPEDRGMHPHVTDCYHSHFYSHDCTFLQKQQLMLQVICPAVHLNEKVKVWIK